MLQIMCNVGLILTNPTRVVKLESIDITEQVVQHSNRLDEFDEACSEVCGHVVAGFALEHQFDQMKLNSSVTVRVW